MKNLQDHELIYELGQRGYAVQCLWSVQDVQSAIDTYNELHNTNYSLSGEDKVTIMNEVLDDEFIFQQINENIEAMVFNYLDEVNK
jgi:hypothetical protein